MAKLEKVSVLLPPDEARRFEAYCQEKGFKKSTLIARLVREHLDSEHFAVQEELFGRPGQTGSGAGRDRYQGRQV